MGNLEGGRGWLLAGEWEAVFRKYFLGGAGGSMFREIEGGISWI